MSRCYRIYILLLLLFFSFSPFALNQPIHSHSRPMKIEKFIEKNKILTGIVTCGILFLLKKYFAIKRERAILEEIKSEIQSNHKHLEHQKERIKQKEARFQVEKQPLDQQWQARLEQEEQRYSEELDYKLKKQKEDFEQAKLSRKKESEEQKAQKQELLSVMEKAKSKSYTFWPHLLANLYYELECEQKYHQKEHPALVSSELKDFYSAFDIPFYVSPFKAFYLPDNASPENITNAYNEQLQAYRNSSHTPTSRQQREFLEACYRNCLKVAEEESLR